VVGFIWGEVGGARMSCGGSVGGWSVKLVGCGGRKVEEGCKSVLQVE
jgi:hypothetical protein